PSPSPSPSPSPTPIPSPTITPNPGYKTLRKGNKNADVLSMQTRLQELGYYTGKLDGHFGQGTYNAVLRFQKRNDLAADGVAGKSTLTILFESPSVLLEEGFSPSPSPTPIPIPIN
ncbi:MAG: hypothetical protein GX786_00760, partial [Clostridiales bacterium]|nr:hypothetical protein [Clostridiales bacterium]